MILTHRDPIIKGRLISDVPRFSFLIFRLHRPSTSSTTIPKNSRSRSTMALNSNLNQTPTMSDNSPAPGIPLQFIFMCMHHVTGEFRRKDGSPLNVLNMDGPYDPDVVFEPHSLPADLPIDSPDHPPIRPLLRVCRHCTRVRKVKERVHIISKGQEWQDQGGSGIGLSRQQVLEKMRQDNYLEDMRLMRKFLGHGIRGLQERVERRVVEGTHPANHNIVTPEQWPLSPNRLAAKTLASNHDTTLCLNFTSTWSQHLVLGGEGWVYGKAYLVRVVLLWGGYWIDGLS